MKLRKLIRHKIIIEASANEGFIVKVGCGIFVFAGKKSLIAGIEEYLDNPEKWEKEYNEIEPGPQPEIAPEPISTCETLRNEPVGRDDSP